MVFANLSEEDKEAFFALLDEYFSSRPELADALHIATPARASAPASAVPRNNLYATAASNPELSSAVGRLAASFAAKGNIAEPKPTVATLGGGRPPPPPRRAASASEPSSLRPPIPAGKAAFAGLGMQQKMGLDTSSGKSTPWGMRKESPSAPAPPAYSTPTAPQSKPLAPPSRRVVALKPRTPEPEPEPEVEYDGEWAEALYDYKPSDPNDLELHAEQRVLVTARTSDDWWTGEADGKSGLFPAAYVKVL